MFANRCRIGLLILLCIGRFNLILSSNSFLEYAVKEDSGKNYVIGYLFSNNTDFDEVRWDALTHINIAFLYANRDGTLNDLQIKKSLRQIVEIAHLNDVKILVSLRDDDQGELVKALTNNRSELIKNLIKFVEDYSLDGIDFDFEDWEREDVIPSVLAFVEEFDKNRGEDILFTCAVNTWDRGYTNKWHTWFDIINVMAYDVHGPWNNEGQHSPYEESLEAIKYWMNVLETPADKLTLGLPFYGYSWNEGDNAGQSYTYDQILKKYPKDAVASNDNIEKIYYNGKCTIIVKTLWAKENNIAGVMIWQIAGDAKETEDSLLEAIGLIMKN